MLFISNPSSILARDNQNQNAIIETYEKLYSRGLLD
jgi:hypothetical protein